LAERILVRLSRNIDKSSPWQITHKVEAAEIEKKGVCRMMIPVEHGGYVNATKIKH
jgi:hypothetical protein